jgi:hypothetical protein
VFHKEHFEKFWYRLDPSKNFIRNISAFMDFLLREATYQPIMVKWTLKETLMSSGDVITDMENFFLTLDLEWKIIYVGSAESEEYDQVLDSVLVGPVPAGRHMFVFLVRLMLINVYARYVSR